LRTAADWRRAGGYPAPDRRRPLKERTAPAVTLPASMPTPWRRSGLA